VAYVWLFILLIASAGCQWAQTPHADPAKFPYPEKATYRIEWRMMTAGAATLQLSRGEGQNWRLQLDLKSVGLVDRMYQVFDSYKLSTNDRFCGVTSALDGHEGKKRFSTRMDFDNARHKLLYVESDLVKNTAEKKEIDISPCTYEVMGALSMLRALKPEPGNTLSLQLTNGKKLVQAKVEAQVRETIHANDKSYSTIRYEALVFNNVVYRRKGRLFMWITDDADRIPVQFRLQMGFPVGTITLELEKHEWY
jgi:uncharacterized protein DUF3108